MPAPSTRLSPLAINKDSWVCGWYDPYGKRRWRSFGNIKKIGKREAERLYAEFAASWHNDPGTRDPDSEVASEAVTVRVLVERYLEYAETYYTKPNGRRATHASNMDHATREIVELCGHRPAASVRASDLRDARDMMIARDLTRVTINERVNRLRHVFKWGVGRDLVPPEVLQKLQAVEPLRRGRSGVREGTGRKTLNPSDIEDILPHLPAPVAGLVRVQWLTGCRPGEAMAMRGCDIDMSEDVWVYSPAEHKTEHYGKTRRIYLGPQAQEVVKPFLKRRLDEYLFSPRDAVVDRQAVRGAFGADKTRSRAAYSQHGERYMAGSYRQAIHRACAKAGIEPWAPYDLRHTAASRLRKDHGEEAARVILGHSRIDTTQMYGEVDETKALAVAAASG